MSGNSWLVAVVAVAALLPTIACHADPATILLYPMPGGTSHLIAMMKVGQQLALRGHRVYVALDDWDHAGVQHKAPAPPGVQCVVNKAYDTIEEGRLALDALVRHSVLDPLESARFFLNHQAQQCRRFLGNPTTMLHVRALGITLVIADVLYPCSGTLADLLGVPRVAFVPTPTMEPIHGMLFGYQSPASTVPALGSALPPIMGFKQRLANFALHHAMRHIIYPMAMSLENQVRREFNVTGRQSLAELMRGVSLLLVNSNFAVDYPRPMPPNVKLVGPLLARPAQPLPAELQAIMQGSGPRGAVYVSFGSTFVLTEEAEVRTLVAAFVALNRSVLWRISEGELPLGLTLADLALPPSVHAMAWAPQNDLLASPHLAAFVSNAGINSLQEAPYHGMPMVSVPFMAEQNDNAARAQYGGFGITVPRAALTAGQPEVLVAAVQRTISEPSFRQNAVKVGRMLRAHGKPGPERAADWVEYALAMPADGSCSLNDPNTHIHWAVRASLDVWALLLVLGWAGVAGVVAVRRRWRVRKEQQKKKEA